MVMNDEIIDGCVWWTSSESA